MNGIRETIKKLLELLKEVEEASTQKKEG